MLKRGASIILIILWASNVQADDIDQIESTYANNQYITTAPIRDYSWTQEESKTTYQRKSKIVKDSKKRKHSIKIADISDEFDVTLRKKGR